MHDQTEHANALRRQLGLSPTEPPNLTSKTASECVSDIRSGVDYCRRLVQLLPRPPRKQTKAAVREFYLEVYTWANFWYAAIGAFVDTVERETHGLKNAWPLQEPTSNMIYSLFGGVGVDLGGIAVRPEPFVNSARAWNAADRESATEAVAAARRALELALGQMETFLPTGPPPKPTLSDTDEKIAELVFNEGPLTGKEIVLRLGAKGHGISAEQVRAIFSDKLKPHYGFTNRRDRRGYRPPPTRTW